MFPPDQHLSSLLTLVPPSLPSSPFIVHWPPPSHRHARHCVSSAHPTCPSFAPVQLHPHLCRTRCTQVAHTAMRGTVFRVHPTGFIVHRPHTASNARKSFLRIKFKSRQNAALLSDSLFQHVEQLWEKHSAELLAGTFEVRPGSTLESGRGSKTVGEQVWADWCRWAHWR